MAATTKEFAQGENLISDYLNGVRMNELEIKYDSNIKTIKKFLTLNFVEKRTKPNPPKSIYYNEKFFTKESPELYYFWGFMLGDGCLQGRSRSLTIALDKSDICILEMFCQWLNISYSNIHFYRNGQIVRLNIYSNYLKNDLSKFGIVPSKTKNPVIPSIPPQYLKPYILGLLDADGHIALNKPLKTGKKYFEVSIVGNKTIVDWYYQCLHQFGYVGNSEIIDPPNKIWKRVKIRGKQDVMSLVKLFDIEMYYDLVLKRKWHDVYDYINGRMEIKFRRISDAVIKNIQEDMISKTMLQKDIAIKNGVSGGFIDKVSKQLKLLQPEQD